MNTQNQSLAIKCLHVHTPKIRAILYRRRESGLVERTIFEEHDRSHFMCWRGFFEDFSINDDQISLVKKQ
jgi:hypothetical protein